MLREGRLFSFRWSAESEERESVRSSDGTITFNWLQQREPDTTVRAPTPAEEAGGTDPWGITDRG